MCVSLSIYLHSSIDLCYHMRESLLQSATPWGSTKFYDKNLQSYFETIFVSWGSGLHSEHGLVNLMSRDQTREDHSCSKRIIWRTKVWGTECSPSQLVKLIHGWKYSSIKTKITQLCLTGRKIYYISNFNYLLTKNCEIVRSPKW